MHVSLTATVIGFVEVDLDVVKSLAESLYATHAHLRFWNKIMVNSTRSDCYAGVQGYGVLIRILAIVGGDRTTLHTQLYI